MSPGKHNYAFILTVNTHFVAGSIPDLVFRFFIDLILLAAFWLKVDSASNTNEYQ